MRASCLVFNRVPGSLEDLDVPYIFCNNRDYLAVLKEEEETSQNNYHDDDNMSSQKFTAKASIRQNVVLFICMNFIFVGICDVSNDQFFSFLIVESDFLLSLTRT